MKIPPYLRRGDTIGITSPAGYITHQEIQPSVQQIQGWGLKIQIGATIGKKFFGFGGTDEERRAVDNQRRIFGGIVPILDA